MKNRVLLVLLLIGSLSLVARAAVLTPGNILLTTSRFVSAQNTVYEYTPTGTQVQTWFIPYPGLDPTAGNARGVAVSPDQSTIYIYNGTSPAFITTITPSTGATGQQQATTLGTANVVYYGNVAATGNYLFAAPADGLVRFSTSDFSYIRYLAGKSIAKLSMGADGNLYVLNTNESVGWPGVEVYDPTTMSLIRSFVFIGGGSNGVTGDADGNVFSIGGNTVYEYSPTGTFIKSLTTTVGLEDIQISGSGQILLGGWGAWILTDESLTLASAHYFPTPGAAPVFVSFVTPVPEPTSMAVVVLGAAPLLAGRRRGLRFR